MLSEYLHDTECDVKGNQNDEDNCIHCIAILHQYVILFTVPIHFGLLYMTTWNLHKTPVKVYLQLKHCVEKATTEFSLAA